MDQADKSEASLSNEPRILIIRGKPVLLDSDLAVMYGIETKTLNRAIKRNTERFPDEFCFSLEPQEVANLKRQFGTSSWGGRRKTPYAFTEHGALMALLEPPPLPPKPEIGFHIKEDSVPCRITRRSNAK